MANDIFNRRTDTFGGSFSADGVSITFPNVLGFDGGQFAGNFGLLVQRLNVAYQQQISRIYEIGSPAIYLVAGRTSGDISMDRVIGPATIQQLFYKKFGDVCQAASNTLDFSVRSGCDNNQRSGQVSLTAFFCVITGIGVGIQAADSLINENLRLMFSSFEYNTAAN